MQNNSKPQQVYYDVQINNFESSNSGTVPLRFSETRNAPIVTNAGDYSLSIVRFELDTYSLPKFIANIEPSQNDPLKMIETITLEYTNGNVTVGPLNLQWVTTNTHLSVPAAPNPLQDNSTDFYYGNSFRHYCDLMNTALASLTTDLKTAVGIALNDLKPPLIIWNESTQIAEIFAQESFYNWSITNHVNIYFNRALYGKFTSFPAIKNYNATDGKFYKIYMKDDYTTKLIPLSLDGAPADVDYIKTSQEYSTYVNNSPVAGIVFTSNTLPVVSSQISAPLTYYNGQQINTAIPNNSLRVISDMATNDLCYLPNLIYVPSGENRLIDMMGNNDITTIDIEVYWKSRTGVLFPFILQSGASCSIKLLFELKQ